MNKIDLVRIKNIFIKKYRSFSPDGEVVSNLAGINIFVGPNGLGKSVFSTQYVITLIGIPLMPKALTI